MSQPFLPTTLRALVDAQDQLTEADDAFALLHAACGGEEDGTLAVPELLSLVQIARGYGFSITRPFAAVTGESRITGWARISPTEDSGAFSIELTECSEDEAWAGMRKDGDVKPDDILGQFPDCVLQLDAEQKIISIENDAPDLAGFVTSVRQAIPVAWRQVLEVAAGSELRMDDQVGAQRFTCRIPGSSRRWTALIRELGDESGVTGFTLALEADQPFATGTSENALTAPTIGRDLTPVLRQPVNRIIANAETIKTRLAGPLKDEYTIYAGDIASAGQHLLSLMDDLADLEVVEAENFTTAPDHIDLADVARRACGILGVRAQERGITLEPPAEGETQWATAEFRRVLQVLLNLIGNAIRYAPENSRVWLRLDALGDKAMITVADQGHGLNAQQQSKVFEKFERLGRGDDGGSGLGLYISRRLARAMGGDLTVESAPGQGARFTLSVPIARSMPD